MRAKCSHKTIQHLPSTVFAQNPLLLTCQELIQQLEDEDVMPSLHDLLHDNNLASTPFPSPSTPRVASGWSSFGFLEDVASGLLEEEMESTEERQTGKKVGGKGRLGGGGFQ